MVSRSEADEDRAILRRLGTWTQMDERLQSAAVSCSVIETCAGSVLNSSQLTADEALHVFAFSLAKQHRKQLKKLHLINVYIILCL